MFHKKLTMVFVCMLILAVSVTGALAAGPITFKVATIESDDTSISRAFRDFEKYVEEKTNGKVDVQYFSNGSLGGEREIIEGVSLGTIQLCFPAPSMLAMYDNKFNLLELPFLYDTYDIAYKAWEGEVGQTVNKWAADVGLQNLGYVAFTARGFANNVRPVRSPEDMKGMKVRVMESQLYIDTFKNLGANPTPMSHTEIFTALQQGTIQAIDRGPMETYMTKLYELCKYYTWLKHTIQPQMLLVKTGYLEKLPEDVRQAILDGIDILRKQLREQLYDDEFVCLEAMRKDGVEVIESLTPEETAKFQALVTPLYDTYRKIVGDELMDKLLAYNKNK